MWLAGLCRLWGECNVLSCILYPSHLPILINHDLVLIPKKVHRPVSTDSILYESSVFEKPIVIRRVLLYSSESLRGSTLIDSPDTE